MLRPHLRSPVAHPGALAGAAAATTRYAPTSARRARAANAPLRLLLRDTSGGLGVGHQAGDDAGDISAEHRGPQTQPPPPIPTSPRVRAIEHQRLVASPTAPVCLSRVGTAVLPTLHSKDTAKPTSPAPPPLEPELKTEFPPPRLAPLVRSTSWAAPGGGGPQPSPALPDLPVPPPKSRPPSPSHFTAGCASGTQKKEG